METLKDMGAEDAGSEVINSFTDSWQDVQHSFQKMAESLQKTCEDSLVNRAIPCFVRSRAKGSESLELKLKERNQKRNYKNFDEIYEDIADLGGARIALYFPKQKDIVDAMIREKFDVVGDPKSFSGGRSADTRNRQDGYNWTFPGYTATHYRVKLKADELQRGHWRKARVLEVQVVSVLGHAWAEVQHDSVSKELAGPASMDEKRIIDSLGGAIYLGECFLDQLCDSQKVRETSVEQTFKNIYEMGFSITSWMIQYADKDEEDLGPLLALKRFLEVLELNRIKDLQSKVQQLYGGVDKDRLYYETGFRYKPFRLTASVYIIDHILNTERDKVQRVLRRAADHPDKHLHHLKVVASAMIWLDELFSPFSGWCEKLLLRLTTEEQDNHLLWLDHSEVALALEGNHALDPNGQAKVDKLWEWFDSHPECVIQFVFGMSKLGVLKKFPDETHLLKRVFYLLNTVLKPTRGDAVLRG